MTRKALLIGAQTNGLTGVLHDVEAMAQALEPRGFQVDRLVTPEATRAAVLSAYEKLIAGARPDDAYVLYYSGHGGRGQQPGGPDLQFIVPDDYDDSTEDDFRGITGVELSVMLARLTAVAPNTTVVLDCCHAAHMSRQTGRRVKALLRTVPFLPSYATVQRHVARLIEAGLPVQQRDLISNPHAVRVVACSPSESAWEGTNADGVPMGLFTDALSRTLRAAEGLRVNWATLLDTVRRDVQDMQAQQRPEAEGPSGRAPFETTELEPVDTLPVAFVAPDRVQLLGAPLFDVQPGDEFTIMPAAATGPQDGPPIGTVTIDRLQPTSAGGPLRLAGDLSMPPDVPPDARAYRTRAAVAALPVRLPHDHPAAGELARALALRPLLRADDTATVEVAADDEGRLVVRDEAGPLHTPYAATALGIGSIMDNLQRIAQAAAIRRLGGDPQRPLAHGVQVEWGRVHDGREETLPLSGALLFAYAGDHLYFRLRNDGDQAMFVSLVDIGVSSQIGVLTATDPGGLRLAPGTSYTYGWDDDRQRLTGVTLTWPDGISTAAARPETVLALISDGPVDVGVLRRGGVRASGDRPGGGSELERLLAQIGTGTDREVGDAPAATVRYAVQPIDFSLSPTVSPAAEQPRFLIDDRPAEPVRLLSPRGAAPRRVAVRIAELIVHRNRALGSADIRVDAMVLTGGTGDQPVYRAETIRFSGVHDDERLPLDNALIYHGPAVDFLDLAVWVSRDASGSLALSSLLEQKLTSPAVQAAGAQLAGLAIAAPQAALAVAVAGAGAVLVNTAYELLTGVVGHSIGLYRTSLLAQEQFGIGRHVRHPQDFTFTFTVDDVD
jgi:hypothetical protein